MRIENVGKNALYDAERDEKGRTSYAYLSVNICGYYQVANYTYQSIRPTGRTDYNILYVTKNRIQIILNGEKKWVEEGEMVLYRPLEPQMYIYHGEDMPEVYWIHFAGRGVEDLLAGLGFTSGNIFRIGKSETVCGIMRSIIGELQVQRENYELYANRHLVHLLSAMSLRVAEEKSDLPDKRYADVQSVIEHINHHYFDDTDNEEYAKMCNLSKYYFMRVFKDVVGVSPHAYKIRVRTSRAKELLSQTSLSIGEIGIVLGYTDAAAFSKQFKKIVGMSPLEYRRDSGDAEDLIEIKEK